MKGIHFHIITLFSESIAPYFESSILGRAKEKSLIKVSFYNPRDFTKDKHKRVDQKPYGGGPGMVLEAESVLRAVKKAIGRKKNVEIFFFTPDGKEFTTTHAKTLAKEAKHVVFICGHYEGVDERVRTILKAKELSVGPYVLTGGELPAAIVIDAVTRYIPGALGKYDSLEDKRTASPDVYTRPEILTWKGKKYRVPKVLLSGNHKEINQWRLDRKKR